MANTSPAYQQSGIATSQFNYPILANDLNSNDRSFWKDLVYKYGKENYNLIMMALGLYADEAMTENHQFYHYEKRGLHQSFAVAADVTAGAAGAAITVTVGSADYYSSGTKSPIRAGEVLMLASSNILVQIVSVNTSTPNAHTATIKPLDSTVVIASAGTGGAKVSANDVFLFRGAVNVGEGSTKLNGISPIWDKVINYVTEHRDDFTISDIALMEKQEVMLSSSGQPYMYNIAVEELNRRFLNEQFWKIMEGVQVTNTGLNANIGNGATNGTIGVIDYVKRGGSTVQYTAGAPTLSDWQALARQLNYYGGASDYHMLCDQLSKDAFDTFLFTTFKGTYDMVDWKHVGGSKEAAVAFGFDTFRINDITWHLFKNPQFSANQVYKRPTPLGAAYDNFALCIPQRQNISKNGTSMPSFQIVYQKLPNGDRINTFETGALAAVNKTTTMEKTFTQHAYYGQRTFGANGFAILTGV